MLPAVIGAPSTNPSLSEYTDSALPKFFERWFRIGVKRSSSSKRGRARLVSWEKLALRLDAVLSSTYFKRTFQSSCELRNDHTQLLPSRNVCLSLVKEDAPLLNQFRNSFPIHLIPSFLISPAQTRCCLYQLIRHGASFLVTDRFPIKAQTLDKGTSLPRIVVLEAEPKQHGLSPCESPTEVLCTREGQTEDEMRVVVFLAFLLQSRVCGTDRRGRVRGKM